MIFFSLNDYQPIKVQRFEEAFIHLISINTAVKLHHDQLLFTFMPQSLVIFHMGFFIFFKVGTHFNCFFILTVHFWLNLNKYNKYFFHTYMWYPFYDFFNHFTALAASPLRSPLWLVRTYDAASTPFSCSEGKNMETVGKVSGISIACKITVLNANLFCLCAD